MAELVPLGLRIESDEVEAADKRLDNFAASAAKAERATDALAAGSGRADGAVGRMIASIERGVRDLVAMGQAQMILAQHAGQAATATQGLAAANDHLGRQAGGAGSAVRQLDAHVDAFRASAKAAADQAKALAAAEKAAAAAANDLATRARTLKSSVDPLGAAFDKVNDELREAEALYSAGVISQSQYGAATEVLRNRLSGLEQAHTRGVGSSKAMTQATLNLTRQFADVGVTAAMGMNPLMILIQQGPQIADAFQMASTQGLKMGEVLKGMAVQFGLLRVVQTGAAAAQAAETAATVAGTAADIAATGAATGLAAAHTAQAGAAAAAGTATTLALGPVLLVLAPIVAAIAAVTAGFALFHREASKAYPKNITDGLNLTEEQLKRVKTTTVSFGDTFAATFTVIGRKIMDSPIGEGLRWLGESFSTVLDGITKGFVYVVAGIPALFGAAFDTIVAHWRNLPAILGDVAITSINFMIRALNALPTKIAAILNMVINFFVGAWEGIVAGAQALPALIAAAFSRAFRGAIDIARSAISAVGNAIRTMSTAALDFFRGTAEAAPGIGAAIAQGVRSGLSGQQFIQAGPLVEELANPFAGAGEAAADTFAERFQARFAENRAALSNFGEEISTEALARARRQALEEAGEANKAAAAAGDQRAQSLQRELDAMEATTAANYELARAYEVSGGAAAEAEARAEAIGKAIRRQGDIELFVAATLALNASKAAVDGAKRLRDVEDTLEATTRLNALVRDGTLTSEAANAQLQLEANLRPLIAAAATEEGDRRAYLLEMVQKLTGQQEALNRATAESQVLADNSRSRDQIAILERETELLGSSNMVRAVTLAQLAKEQELRGRGIEAGSPAWESAIQAARDLATAQVSATEAATNHNAALNEQLNALQAVEDRARAAGAGMAEAFGPVGKALGDLTSMIAGYATAQEESARRTADAIRAAGSDQVAVDRITRQSADANARARIDHYGDLLSASKGFFSQESLAYRTLQVAEQAYRAFQFAMSLKALVMKGAETTATVAGAGIETAAVLGAETAKTAATATGSAMRIPMKIAEGAASMFAALGPFGFIAVGAMVAVMAALGFGGSGGATRSAPVMPTTNRGTGTVLGNPNDPSESLTRSLEMSERYWNRDLDYSSKMVTSLRAIQANIGSLTTAIAREMNVGGALDPSGLNQGPTTSGGFLGIGATTRSANVVGSGINLNGGQLADLIANGVSGSLYQIVQNTKTKSGFLGFGGGTTTWNTETSTGIDQSLSRELSRVLASLRNGVLTAAGQLGVTGAEAVLDAFQVNLGRISFEGMSSTEISAALNAVLSAAGDDMARTVLPGLEALQQAGEGLLETLVRVATEYQVVDQVLATLGSSFGAVGLESIEARSRLIELAGGLDAFTESADFFAENFLTEAQRIAPVQAAVTAELTRLGLATDINRTQFADLVRGLDVSTEAGAQMYAALMALAPALDRTLRYAEELTGGLNELSNAAEVASQRRSLEIALMEATGDAAGALAARRADELAALYASNRPLQEAIWAAEDARSAQEALAEAQRNAASAVNDARSDLSAAYDRESSALTRTRDRFAAFAKTLSDFRRNLDLDSGLGSISYEAARAEAMRVGALAALGDEEALGGLPGSVEKFLEASRANAATELQYLQDLTAAKLLLQKAEATATRTASNADRQLVELQRSVSGLIQVNDSVLSVRDAIQRLQVAMMAQAAVAGRPATPATGTSPTTGTGPVNVVEGIVSDPRYAYGQTPGQAGNIEGRDYGANPGMNRALAGLTGYLGSFANGAFETWVSGQSASIQNAARSFYQNMDMIPGFATGGSGIVGGFGGPDSQLIQMRLTPGELVSVQTPGQAANDDLVAIMREVAAELRALRTEQAAANGAIATNTGRTARTLDGWDDDGLPEEREVA